MGIVKIEIKIPELVKAIEIFKETPKRAFEEISNEIRHSISETFNNLLQTEFEIFIGSAEQSSNKRNGFDEREFAIKGIGCIKLRMPIDRQRNFKSVIIPKNAQIDLRLKEDLAVLHLAGISNRTLSLISKRILGVEVSAQTVHNSLSILESKALKWLDRDIKKNYWALFIDGTNFKTQRRGSTEKEPTLVVLGIDDRNSFSILALQPGQKDDASSWSAVFDDLIKRGLDPKIEGQITDNLPKGYAIQELDSDPFWEIVEKKMEEVFANDLIFRVREIYSDLERGKLKSLNERFKHPYLHHAVIRHDKNIVGWTWGYQDSRDSFYMVNSGVLPEHRGKGLYSRLLQLTLQKLMNEGFQRIWSRHNNTKNEIIISKLKQGFQITGTELSDVFGSLVHLTYFTNPTRKKVLNFRSGHLRPDSEVKKVFDL